ncbi:hypothetical protein Chor_002448 [Crotalus horridus]
MAALRSLVGILAPLQLGFLLPVQVLAEGSFERIVGGPPSQSPEAVSIIAGSDLLLKCTLTQTDLPATAEWYKDLGNDQTLIYRQSDKFSRGVRVLLGSPIDFSVSLSNMRPEDSGTYRCSMIKEGPQAGERTPKKLTVVSVVADPSQPLLRGPPDRIAVGSLVSFSCSAKEFPSCNITVLWLKDKNEIQAARTDFLNYTTKVGTQCRVESTVEILPTQEDLKSVLSCRVQHQSLRNFLQQDLLLVDVLRGG